MKWRDVNRAAYGHRVLSVPDAISSTNPRVIDDARARKLSSDLKRCTYYETCATYGLNVERVFQDGKRSPPRIHVPFRGAGPARRESECPPHAGGRSAACVFRRLSSPLGILCGVPVT